MNTYDAFWRIADAAGSGSWQRVIEISAETHDEAQHFVLTSLTDKYPDMPIAVLTYSIDGSQFRTYKKESRWVEA